MKFTLLRDWQNGPDLFKASDYEGRFLDVKDTALVRSLIKQGIAREYEHPQPEPLPVELDLDPSTLGAEIAEWTKQCKDHGVESFDTSDSDIHYHAAKELFKQEYAHSIGRMVGV